MLPGTVDENDIELQLMGDTLAIRGEKKQEAEKKEKDVYRVERAYGSFQRVLSSPQDADRENIDARFMNGVLTVTLRRKADSKPADGQVIDIKRASGG